MKSMLRLLAVSSVTLMFAAAGFAQTGPAGSTGAKPSTSTAKPAEKKAPAPKVIRARGELTAADAKAGMAKVKTKDKELSLSSDAQDVKDSLAKMKVGDAVRVAYVESEGKLTLRSIAKSKLPTTTKSTNSNANKSSTSMKSSTTDAKPATK